MARQPANHSSLWRWGGGGGDNCLNMPQLALTEYSHSSPLTHILVARCYAAEVNLHVRPRRPSEKLTSTCRLPFSSNLHGPFAATTAHKNRVNPKAAAPLPWMSPNPFTQGLSISSCRVRNTLPRCHYCTITYQIPPVYYHYRSVSAIINDRSTPADERDY